MRAFLTGSLAFLLPLLVSLGAIDQLAAHAFVSHYELKYREIFEGHRQHPDVILGTSHAAYGINPRFLEHAGYRPYNFAYDGSNPLFYQSWYPLFKRHCGQPRTVLFDVDWFAFKPAMWHRFEHDSRYLPADELWRLATQPNTSLSLLLSNRFALLQEHDAIQAALLGQASMQRRLLQDYYQGYVPLKYKAPDFYKEPYHQADLPEREPALEQFIRTLQADGARVLFVQTPEYLPVAGEHPNENARLAALARRVGVPFLNYNQEKRSPLNQDRALFEDWGHLNDGGARRFSQALAVDLKAVGF